MPETTTINHEEISLWLDSYDDLFSDFDPRSYTRRVFSDDFILQAKKLTQDRKGRIGTLKLLLPEMNRKRAEEITIAKRLHSHFINFSHELIKKKKKTIYKGAWLSLTGLLFMITASYISYMESGEYFIHLLRVIFEPSGWFLLWMGLDHLVYYSRKQLKDIDFYSKIAEVNIIFESY